MSWEAVNLIRNSTITLGTRAALAKQFGVSWTTIGNILKGKTWTQ